jgi:plastocyanin
MSKRFLGSVVFAFALTVLMFAATAVFFSKSTQAEIAGVALSGVQAPDLKAPVSAPDGAWSDIAPFPTATIDFTPTPALLRLKRAGAAAYPLNGKIYVMGGRHGTDGEDTTLRWIWEYTPGSPGSWLRKNALLDQAAVGSRWTANMAVAVLTDTTGPKIYAVGGSSIDSSPTPVVRVYDPVLDSLTNNSDAWPASPNRVPGGYAVYNNKLYIFGGFSAIGAGGVFTDTWVFDPMAASGSRWTQLASANLGLGRGYIAGAVLDGKIYAIGGDTWNPGPRTLVPVNNVEMMDPTQPSPTWTAVASLPTARGDLGAWAYDTGTGYEISGKIAVAGGNYPAPDAIGYLYDRVTNSWSSFPSMTHASRNYGVAQLNGFLYAFGGYENSTTGANFSQRYDATGPGNTPTPTITGTPPTSTRTVTGTSSPAVTFTPPATITLTPAPTVCGVLINEGFESPTGLGPFSSDVATCNPGGCGWTSVTTAFHSGARSAFAPNVDDISDQRLVTTNAFLVTAGSTLTFWHRYLFENPTTCYDGGVLEVSTNGGTTWTDAGTNITSGGYNGTVNSNFENPLAGRAAWCNSSAGTGFLQVNVNLTPYAGQSVKFRFRLGTDNSVPATGWWIDDVVVTGAGCPPTGTPGTPATSTATFTATRTATGTATSVPPATITNTPGPSNTATRTSTPCSINFNDVFPTDYFYEPVRYLWCAHVISGYDTSPPCGATVPCFKPYNNTTRGQMAKIVILGFQIPLSTNTTPMFSDVPQSNPFFTEIQTAAENDIVSGYADGTFRPFNNVTRGQLSKIVVVAASITLGWEVINPPNPHFSDVPQTNPFYTFIETAFCHGIISGYADGTFRWGADATRGQIAKIVYLAVLDQGKCASGGPTVTSTAVPPTQTRTPTATPVQVNIQGFAFSPQNLTIVAGTTVNWTNLDPNTHTATSDTAVWDSGDLAQNQSYPHTFAAAGTYPYHCTYHPGMTGTITVTTSAGSKP